MKWKWSGQAWEIRITALVTTIHHVTHSMMLGACIASSKSWYSSETIAYPCCWDLAQKICSIHTLQVNNSNYSTCNNFYSEQCKNKFVILAHCASSKMTHLDAYLPAMLQLPRPWTSVPIHPRYYLRTSHTVGRMIICWSVPLRQGSSPVVSSGEWMHEDIISSWEWQL